MCVMHILAFSVVEPAIAWACLSGHCSVTCTCGAVPKQHLGCDIEMQMTQQWFLVPLSSSRFYIL